MNGRSVSTEGIDYRLTGSQASIPSGLRLSTTSTLSPTQRAACAKPRTGACLVAYYRPFGLKRVGLLEEPPGEPLDTTWKKLVVAFSPEKVKSVKMGCAPFVLEHQPKENKTIL